MSGMPLIFFLLLLRFLVLPVQKHCHLPSTDKYLSAKLSPHHLYRCSRCFVSLHTDIQFWTDLKSCQNICCQGSVFTYNVYLHSKFFSVCSYRPARKHTKKECFRADRQQPVSLYFIVFILCAINSRTCTRNTTCDSVLS